MPKPDISREAYAQQNGLDASRTWIALLPGSRRKEVKANLSAMMQAAALLQAENARYQFLFPVATSLNVEWFRNMMAQTELAAGKPDALTTMVPVKNAAAALLHSRAAAVTSGTATVEAALMGTPFVTVYRLSPLTFFAAKRLVKVPFLAIPNLLAAPQILPELLPTNFHPE